MNTDTLWIISWVTTGIAIILFSFSVTMFILGERPIYKAAVVLLLVSLLAEGISYGFGHKASIRDEQARAEREKAATYYEVTPEMKKDITSYCEAQHVKFSTQRSCISNISYSLKHGEKTDGFTPSTVVTKPSGVAPSEN